MDRIGKAQSPRPRLELEAIHIPVCLFPHQCLFAHSILFPPVISWLEDVDPSCLWLPPHCLLLTFYL